MAGNLFTFYQDIIENELSFANYNEIDMDNAADILLASYSVAGLKIADSLDFNRKELRCAYIHLFATSHSHMVMDALDKLLPERLSDLLQLIMAAKFHGSLNVTALGGGPGSDPLGFLNFLDKTGYLDSCPMIKVAVVDKYTCWEQTCRSVMKRFNRFPMCLHFTAQDLLMPMSAEVMKVLRDTHFLSMVKFISAIAGDKYRTILSLKRVFELLQPGSMVLLIDNAGGHDFREALEIANITGLEPVISPLLHYDFKVPKHLEYNVGTPRFGKRAQTSSKISIAILKKRGCSGLYANSIHMHSNAHMFPQAALHPRRIPVSSRSGSVHISRNNAGSSSSILDRLQLARYKSPNISQPVQPARSISLAYGTSTRFNSSNVLPSSRTSANLHNIRSSNQPQSTHWSTPNRRTPLFYAQQTRRPLFWYQVGEVPDPISQLVIIALGILFFYIVANEVMNKLRKFLTGL